MTHFDLTKWTDFVRGVTEPDLRLSMQSHLDSGCDSCGGRLEMLRRFVAAVRSEKSFEVPAHVVSNAKALFPRHGAPIAEPLVRLAARLVFDSFHQPLAQGVRGQRVISRQTLHEADTYSLDMRIEQERGREQAHVIGQVFDRLEPAPLAGIPVIVTSGDIVLSRVESNDHGEFQFRYEPAVALRLIVAIPQKNVHIEVDLTGITPDSLDEA
jgi:hypothetical protein